MCIFMKPIGTPDMNILQQHPQRRKDETKQMHQGSLQTPRITGILCFLQTVRLNGYKAFIVHVWYAPQYHIAVWGVLTQI